MNHGITSMPVRTTHAFHSPAMDQVSRAMRRLFAAIDLKPPRIPFASNVTGRLIRPEETRDPDYWCRHLCQAVRFSDGLHSVCSKDHDNVFIELGPGQALASFAMAEIGGEGSHLFVPTVRASFDGEDDRAFLLRSIGRLWTDGIAIDWRAFHAGQSHRRVALPTYAFERTRHWATPQDGLPVEDVSRSANRDSSSDPLMTKLPLDSWFWVPSWERTIIRSYHPERNRSWVIFALQNTISECLATRLSSSGERVRLVWPGEEFRHEGDSITIDPTSAQHYDAVFDELPAHGTVHVVHGWSLVSRSRDELESFNRTLELGFNSVLLATQAIAARARDRAVWLSLLTSGARTVTGDEVQRPLDATLLGFARVAPQELRALRCQLIDLTQGPHDAALLDRLLGDVSTKPTSACTAHRGAYRWQEKLVPHLLEPPAGPQALGDGAVILISGGPAAA
jgi:phthiocerol/phenolphthiocerol synthesis type-I polyketide synthase E